MEDNFTVVSVLQVLDGTVIPTANQELGAITPRILRMVMALVICLSGAFGNILVILAIVLNPSMRTVTNYLLLSLAVTDLIVCTCIGPLAIYDDWRAGDWRIGSFLCNFWKVADILLICCSIWHLCAVSVDRYLALFRPLWYRTKRTVSFALILITFSWIVTTLTSVSLLISARGHFHEFHGSAVCFVQAPVNISTFFIAVNFFIPSGILLLLYGRMRSAIFGKRPTRLEQGHDNQHAIDGTRSGQVCNIATISSDSLPVPGETHEQGQLLSHQYHGISSSPNVSQQTTSNSTERGHPSGESRQLRQFHEEKIEATSRPQPSIDSSMDTNKKERKASIIIVILVITFIICWGPFFLFLLILQYFPSSKFVQNALTYFSWFGYLNSAVNPLIYTIFNKKFRDAFRKILMCKRRGQIGVA